ncbi:MAG: hypothetical protein R3B46_01010 [Phycisphaerales bacterium]
MRRWTLPLVASLVIAAATNAQVAPPPVAGLADTAPILGGDHDPSIKSPRDMLGFEVGEQAATHAEIERCFKEWNASPRAQLVEYARSHENRPLYYMVISSEANIRNLNSIKADLAKIADPRNNADTDGLARSTRRSRGSRIPSTATRLPPAPMPPSRSHTTSSPRAMTRSATC